MLSRCVLLLCAVVTVHGFNLGPNDILFHLFTRSNPTVSQPLLANVNSIGVSSFDLGRRTIITVHSYTETVTGNFNAHLVPAHLNAEDVNFLAVDWTRGSTTYSVGLANSPQVGAVIATFINILEINFGYNVNLVTIVGVGLGGHIAGIAARRANAVVPRVIALDPSLIGWSHHPEKLSTDAATVVEVLYTTAGRYGYDRPLGHLNFYANGGVQQTGCGTNIPCSHVFSYIFLAESITAEVNNGPKFVATECGNYTEAMANQCSGARGTIFGGSGDKKGITGVFTFNTNLQAPFAQG